ncbi:TPA: hypothetical protein ACH3X1_013407 [Trebouxia sp. C0004]
MTTRLRLPLGILVMTWWINHSVPYGMLSEKQLAVYGKTFKVTLPCVTRWGSHVNSIQSLLDIKQAMRSLVLESRPYLEDSQAGLTHSKQRNRMKHERVTKMVQVKKMLHANRPKRAKIASKAQVQPGEEAYDYELDSATASASLQGNSAGDLEALPDLVCNQEEFDECVKEWLYELELEGLT